MNHLKKLLAGSLFAAFVLLNGCIPQRKLVLFQKNANAAPDSVFRNQDYEFVIAPFDLLSLRVTSTVDPQSVAVFNPVATSGGGNPYLSGTLVDKNGDIEIPYAGKIRVAGLTLAAATDTISSQLSVYLQDVDKNLNISLKVMNFSVNVLGEVAQPGVVEAENEFLTVTDVLARSGGISDFGNRQNVKIIRSDRLTKKTTTYRLDLTSAESVDPILARLQPGDVIYVEPLSRKRYTTASQVLGLGSAFISISLVIVSIVNLARTFN